MNIIYEPKGAALEYAPLALNLYNGCTHACKYCYCPRALKMKSSEDFFKSASPKENIIDRLVKDAGKMAKAGDTREIFLSFIGDPYQPAEADLKLTRSAIEILRDYNLNFCILTKGGNLATRDFDLLEDYPGARFGVTLTLHKPKDLVLWEPEADSPLERMRALRIAHDYGIKTWASIEPVIDPRQALEIIDELVYCVDHFKIGKINHVAGVGKQVDWIKFRKDVSSMLRHWDASFYIKDSLRNL
jgi:DNA repair photolyase